MKNTKKFLSTGVALAIALFITGSSNCDYTGYPGGRGSSKHASYYQDVAKRQDLASTANEPATQGGLQTVTDMVIRLTDKLDKKINALANRVSKLERNK